MLRRVSQLRHEQHEPAQFELRVRKRLAGKLPYIPAEQQPHGARRGQRHRGRVRPGLLEALARTHLGTGRTGVLSAPL